jgi:hypothetical protein
MGKLSELVKRDYDEEVKIIRDAGGHLWLTGLGAAFFFAVMWGVDLLFRDAWSQREIGYAIICVLASPFIIRTWERHRVAEQMRHERQVRVEVKLDALLGLVNIEDV